VLLSLFFTHVLNFVSFIRAQRIRTFWCQIMKEGKVPVDLQFINTARALVPRIDQAATKLMALANMNRTVHLPTYNKLIGEEAQKLSAES